MLNIFYRKKRPTPGAADPAKYAGQAAAEPIS